MTLPAFADDRCPDLCLTHHYAAPAAAVFAAFAQADLARQWWFATAQHPLAAAAIDARPGGALLLRERRHGFMTEYRGAFLAVDAPARLTFTLTVPEAPDADTRVHVEITPRLRGCVLLLSHEGVPPCAATANETRWLGSLYGLGETLDALAAVADPASAAAG